jgi:hypothetical protein
MLAGCGVITVPPATPQQWIYDIDTNLQQIRVDPLTATETVTPVRMIGGPHTHLSGPLTMAPDKNRNLYVGNQGDLHGITLYPPDAYGM